MAHCKAREQAPIVHGICPSEQGQTRPGERIGVAFGPIEKQRDPRLKSDVTAVLCKVREQQQRARVEVGGNKHERGVGRTPQAGGKCSPVAATQ